MSRLALAAVALVLASAGCSHGTKHAKASTPPAPHAPASTQTVHGVLHGDVDGDGVPDEVSVRWRCRTPDQCVTFLEVRTRSGTLTRQLTTRSVAPPAPFLNGLAQIGRGPGLKIVATTWMGASTGFARVFAVRHGRISEIVLSTPDGAFPYAGSVTHWDAVDCVRGGQALIVTVGEAISGATPPAVSIERRYYRVGTRRFRLVRIQREKRSAPSNTFARQPLFPTCMRNRAD